LLAWTCLTPLALVVASPGAHAVATASVSEEVFRTIVVTSRFAITDDEWGGDEHAQHMASSESVVGSAPRRVLTTGKGMGGEVRVELDLDAHTEPNNDVRVSGELRLYEGTSESTSDLDGRRLIQEVVHPGQRTVSLRVDNDDEGGDFAEVTIDLDNRPAIPVEQPRRVDLTVLDVTAHDTEDALGADEFYLTGAANIGSEVSQIVTAPMPVNDNSDDFQEPLLGREGVLGLSAVARGDYPFTLFLRAWDEDAGTDWPTISKHGAKIRDELTKLAVATNDPRAMVGAAAASVVWEAVDLAGSMDEDDHLGNQILPAPAGAAVAELGVGTKIYEARFRGSWAGGIGDISDWNYTVRYRITVTALPMDTALPSVPTLPTVPVTPAARTLDRSCPSGRVPASAFTDVPTGSIHERAISCLVWWKVANGRTASTFAPNEPVTRDAMAAFVARALLAAKPGSLSHAPPDAFVDDSRSVHQNAINQLAERGIVGGTGAGTYSPSGTVTRGQMAKFLANATATVLGQPLPAGRDVFSDDDGNLFEPDINRVAQAGITGGRAEGIYAPGGVVTREQMGSFLARTLDLLVENGVELPT
jgi:hypothetical protein